MVSKLVTRLSECLRVGYFFTQRRLKSGGYPQKQYFFSHQEKINENIFKKEVPEKSMKIWRGSKTGFFW